LDRKRILALRVYQVFSNVLFDPIVASRRVAEAPSFIGNLVRYWTKQEKADPSFRVRLRYLFPVLGERGAGAGVASGHYFHQDIWAARQVHARNPEEHVDIGSSVSGFIAHLLCFREVEYVDLRPLRTNVDGLHFKQGTLLALPYESDSLDSVSALHVVEHIGLGRYGEPIDHQGWRLACEELQRILKPNGHLYFSVPIGPQRLEFDGHRVFDPRTIVRTFDRLRLTDFACVDDRGDYLARCDPDHFAGWYGCGLFHFVKP
jgi:SAM-dependent methyltransferase